MSINRQKETPEYYTMAGHAAKLERTARYDEASNNWLKARQLASTALNSHWCEVRHLRCSKYNIEQQE